MGFSRFIAALHTPSIVWWPFPFLQPEVGKPFGRFRLFTCATLYPLFFWSFISVLLVLKRGVALDYLLLLFVFLHLFFLLYYSTVAYCWNRIHRVLVDTE